MVEHASSVVAQYLISSSDSWRSWSSEFRLSAVLLLTSEQWRGVVEERNALHRCAMVGCATDRGSLSFTALITHLCVTNQDGSVENVFGSFCDKDCYNSFLVFAAAASEEGPLVQRKGVYEAIRFLFPQFEANALQATLDAAPGAASMIVREHVKSTQNTQVFAVKRDEMLGSLFTLLRRPTAAAVSMSVVAQAEHCTMQIFSVAARRRVAQMLQFDRICESLPVLTGVALPDDDDDDALMLRSSSCALVSQRREAFFAQLWGDAPLLSQLLQFDLAVINAAWLSFERSLLPHLDAPDPTKCRCDSDTRLLVLLTILATLGHISAVVHDEWVALPYGSLEAVLDSFDCSVDQFAALVRLTLR